MIPRRKIGSLSDGEHFGHLLGDGRLLVQRRNDDADRRQRNASPHSPCRLLDDTAAPQLPFRRREVLPDRSLRPHPVEVAVDPLAQPDGGREAERTDARGVAEQRPHLAGAKLAGDERCDRLPQPRREQPRQIANGRRLPRADVEDLAVGAGILGYQQIRPRHVFDEDQVARLPAIFVDDDGGRSLARRVQKMAMTPV